MCQPRRARAGKIDRVVWDQLDGAGWRYMLFVDGRVQAVASLCLERPELRHGMREETDVAAIVLLEAAMTEYQRGREMTSTHTHTRTHTVVSRHLLRRRARAKAARLTRRFEAKLIKQGMYEHGAIAYARDAYDVFDSGRGPFRWHVVKY